MSNGAAVDEFARATGEAHGAKLALALRDLDAHNDALDELFGHVRAMHAGRTEWQKHVSRALQRLFWQVTLHVALAGISSFCGAFVACWLAYWLFVKK